MARNIGERFNTSDLSAYDVVSLNNNAAVVLKVASEDFIFLCIQNPTNRDVWIRFKPASTDPTAKEGLLLSRGNSWEMPSGNKFVGEISAISRRGNPDITIQIY